MELRSKKIRHRNKWQVVMKENRTANTKFHSAEEWLGSYLALSYLRSACNVVVLRALHSQS